MIKLIIKLAIAALIANAAWRVGSAYVTFYRFNDALTEVSQFEAGQSQAQAQLQQKVLELADQYDVPLTDDGFTLTRDEHRTEIKGSYTREIQLFPGYTYPWPFRFDVNTVNPMALLPAKR